MARHRGSGLSAVAVVAGVLVALWDARPATWAQTSTPATTRAAVVRFEAVHVYVDSKDRPLAAYQCEVSATRGDVKIVGIEGNPRIAAFADPPYYDPKAMLEERLILAAFSTRKDLPKGNVRVATIHVQITGDIEPVYTIRSLVAGSESGEPTSATANVIQGEQPRSSTVIRGGWC